MQKFQQIYHFMRSTLFTRKNIWQCKSVFKPQVLCYLQEAKNRCFIIIIIMIDLLSVGSSFILVEFLCYYPIVVSDLSS